LQQTGRDIFTSASKKFVVQQQVSGNDILEHCREEALTLLVDNKEIIVTDIKNRCHLKALQIKD